MASRAGTCVCGDDVRRGCRLAVVERCRNRTLFKDSIQERVLRTTAYRTGVLCFLKHRISCVFKESSMREFQADGRTISAYLAVPEHGSGPGVLVLHAWWGLTEPFRHVCDRLAVAGFCALDPRLSHCKTTPSIEGDTAMVTVRVLNVVSDTAAMYG